MIALLGLDGRVREDAYVKVDSDDAALPAHGDIVVSLSRWERERNRLSRRHGRVGVHLTSDEAPERLAADLDTLDMIALEFPSFRDGRAYSHARLLRERFGYGGEVRAVGDVLIEQLAFMARVGFDAFEVDCDDPEADFRLVAGEVSVWYQPAADDRASIIELRHGRR